MTLTPIDSGHKDKPLFFVFGDLTNGHQTYAAGRFLLAEAPAAGRVILDFNLATNPMCAYNHPFFVCPLPHKESRLAVPVSAGEQIYPTPVTKFPSA